MVRGALYNASSSRNLPSPRPPLTPIQRVARIAERRYTESFFFPIGYDITALSQAAKLRPLTLDSTWVVLGVPPSSTKLSRIPRSCSSNSFRTRTIVPLLNPCFCLAGVYRRSQSNIYFSWSAAVLSRKGEEVARTWRGVPYQKCYISRKLFVENLNAMHCRAVTRRDGPLDGVISR